MTTPSSSPKPPRAPRRTGFGSFATSTGPVATPPAQGDQSPQPGLAPVPAAAPDPVTGPPNPQTTGSQPVGDTHPGPSTGGGQLAALFAGATGADGDLARAMLAGPPIDPMLDLVSLGVSIPRHYKRALDNIAHVTGRKKQDLVVQALTALLGEELLSRSLPQRH
jgi:hypothetical protein